MMYTVSSFNPAYFSYRSKGLADNYAPAFYWSIIETNAGILSACLPTLRPILREYPVMSSLSRLVKSFTTSFKSTLRSSETDIRLTSRENSLENGLPRNQNKVSATRGAKTIALMTLPKIRPLSIIRAPILSRNTITQADPARRIERHWWKIFKYLKTLRAGAVWAIQTTLRLYLYNFL